MCSCSRIKGRVMREREWMCFFSRALTLICSHHLFLAADKSSIVRVRVNSCFRADDSQLTPGQRSALSGAWCSDLKQYRWIESLLTSSSGQSSLLRPQGMCLTIISFFVINNFLFFFHTQHNIQNKTKQNSRHILNISRFNQKGGREGRTTRTHLTIISVALLAKWQLSTQMYVNMLYLMLEKYC